MAEHSIEKQLQIFFPKPTRSDWLKVAVQETNGKDPFETCAWRGKDDIQFLPYYDERDVAALHTLPADNAQQKYHWLNLPAINVTNESHANKIALEYLSLGANGVFFYLDKHTTSTVDVITRDIDVSRCNLFFRIKNEEVFENAMSSEDWKSVLERIKGALFWESIPKISKLDRALKRWKKFHALGIVIPPSSPTQEIAHALLNGVQVYEHYAQTADEADVFGSICFSVSADASLLETVAKIKALRSLWLQIAGAFGHDDYNSADLHIHTRSLPIADAAYAPHEDMLHATFASMAATAAGCNSLTVESSIDKPLFQRWSTHVSNILREESFFDGVANPLAGAYAVEVMSDAIAKKAWEIFQTEMQAL